MGRGKTRVVGLLMVVALVASLSGCSLFNKDDGPSKEELQQMNLEYANQLGEQADKIKGLQETLDKLAGNKGTPAGNMYTIETGTGRTFNSLGGSITLPVDPVYPNSVDSPASTGVRIDTKYTVFPGGNWSVTLDNTTCTMFHSSGITVKFKMAKIDNRVEPANLKAEMFDNITNAIPAENIRYGTIFFDEAALGGTVAFTTSVDEKPAQMRVGAFGDSDRSLTFVTLYEGDTDSTKEEVIEKLLNSINYGTTALVVN